MMEFLRENDWVLLSLLSLSVLALIYIAWRWAKDELSEMMRFYSTDLLNSLREKNEEKGLFRTIFYVRGSEKSEEQIKKDQVAKETNSSQIANPIQIDMTPVLEKMLNGYSSSDSGGTECPVIQEEDDKAYLDFERFFGAKIEYHRDYRIEFQKVISTLTDGNEIKLFLTNKRATSVFSNTKEINDDTEAVVIKVERKRIVCGGYESETSLVFVGSIIKIIVKKSIMC